MNTKRLFAVALVLLLALPAFAGKKDDLYNQAQAAAAAGRVEEATSLFCQVAKEDSKYKDAKLNCEIMSKELDKEKVRSDERFQAGVADFNAGRYDDAEQKFRNVRAGSHVADARDYVANKIPQARASAQQAKSAAAAEQAMAQKFDQATQAYNSNDFNGAKALFSQITGPRQGDAQDYLRRINKYDAAMAEGDRLAAAKNYKQAASSYDEAAAVKADGPGNPRDRSQQMMASASGGRPAPGGGRPAATTTTTTTATTPTPGQPSRDIVAAVKNVRPQVDAAKMLSAADNARKKGNFSEAAGKYAAVLAADSTNAQARVALEAVKAELRKEQSANGGASVPKAGSDADVMLTRAIGEFYSGRFDQAEVHIQDYLDVNGSKTALSYFYLGVSKLTRYYLGGAQESDRKLLRDAKDAFRQAKQSPGFQPPEQYVSPKILKVYSGA